MRSIGAAVVAGLIFFAVPAAAQNSADTGSIAELLSAPADPIAYHRDAALAAQLLANGKLAEAAAIYHRLAPLYPNDGRLWRNLARAERRLGHCAEALPAYHRAAELLGPTYGDNGFWIATCQVAVGDKGGALATLDRLVSDEHYLGRAQLMEEEGFASLRDDPRFKAIAGRLNTEALGRDEGWRTDLDYLVSEIKRNDPEYHTAELPEAFNARYRELRAAIPQLTDEEIFVRMNRLIATLRHGHTSLWPFLPARRMEFKQLPLQMYVFPEGLFVVDVYDNERDLLGARVQQIGSTDAVKALEMVGEMQGGESNSETLWTGPYNLGVAQVLKGLDIISDVDHAEVTFKLHNGRTVSRKLTTIPMKSRPKLGAPPAVAAPLAFQHVAESHWLQPLPAHHAIYVQVNQMTPDPDETLPAFGLRLRQTIKQFAPRAVIVDLRHNNGGNTLSYPELLRSLVSFSAEGGQVYAIIGRDVYSACANFITDLERLADPIFVGEPSSMTGNQHGDESSVELPWSGIRGGFTGVAWQLSDPSDHRRSIFPDVPVQLTAQAYFKGRDPVLETALNMVDAQGAAAQ